MSSYGKTYPGDLSNSLQLPITDYCSYCQWSWRKIQKHSMQCNDCWVKEIQENNNYTVSCFWSNHRFTFQYKDLLDKTNSHCITPTDTYFSHLPMGLLANWLNGDLIRITHLSKNKVEVVSTGILWHHHIDRGRPTQTHDHVTHHTSPSQTFKSQATFLNLVT